MKKFILATFVMAALMLCPVAAKAYNYDCGAYPATGLHGYLMTETVRLKNGGFDCTIVCYPSGRPYHINYNFYWIRGECYFRNSDGYESMLSWRTPVEQNAYDHVLATHNPW